VALEQVEIAMLDGGYLLIWAYLSELRTMMLNIYLCYLSLSDTSLYNLMGNFIDAAED
jgi:hypothetical protein